MKLYCMVCSRPIKESAIPSLIVGATCLIKFVFPRPAQPVRQFELELANV